VRARGASTGSQCVCKHRSTIFYIKLIVFVSKGFNPRFDFLFKIRCEWVGGALHRMAQGEGGRGRGAAQLEAARLGMAQPARSGRRKNRGEALAQGGFQPKVNEIKRRCLSYLWFQILNEFYSNSNNF
jgi:hypothetical protein